MQRIPWNKGLTINDCRVARCVEAAAKGRRGKPPWNKGKGEIKVCLACGANFPAQKGAKKYCSWKCYLSRYVPHNKGQGKRIKCKVCERHFYVDPQNKRNRRFCSRECYFKDKVEIKECIYCHTKEPKSRMKGAYCSTECYLRHRWENEKERQKLSIKRKKDWKENRDKLVKSMSEAAKRRIQREGLDNFVQRIRKALEKRPTALEEAVLNLVEKHCLPFRYVGNGDVIIGGRNPDFINVNGKKQVIEVFGNYWHDLFDVARRTEHYGQYGFQTLIIWEDELENPDQVLAKIKAFERRRRWKSY